MRLALPKIQNFKLATNLILSYSVLSILISGVFSILMFLILSLRMEADLHQRLLDIARLTAGQIDGDAHAKLLVPADNQDPAYEKIRKALIAIHSTIPGVSYAYTLRQNKEGQVAWVVDDDESGPTDIGTVYEDPGPVLASQIGTLTGPVTEAAPYTDEWRT